VREDVACRDDARLPVRLHDDVRGLLAEERLEAVGLDLACLRRRLNPEGAAVPELRQQRPVVRADIHHQVVRLQAANGVPYLRAARSSKLRCSCGEFPDEYGYSAGNMTSGSTDHRQLHEVAGAATHQLKG
jgi:hypothetical protein